MYATRLCPAIAQPAPPTSRRDYLQWLGDLKYLCSPMRPVFCAVPLCGNRAGNLADPCRVKYRLVDLGELIIVPLSEYLQDALNDPFVIRRRSMRYSRW